MHIQTDRALIPAGARATRYLHVTIAAPSAPARAAQPRPAVDVAFVLDRSGSMDGSKLAMARRAVAHALRLLTPNDRFALVVYDDAVDVVQPATAGTHEAVALALRRLDGVEARGSTNLADGWMRGAEALRTRSARGHVADAGATPAGDRIRRVLLLTDGLANQGLTDPDALAEVAARLRAEGIGTSTFGVGVDFDESLLARLAQQGGGHFYYIETPGQIPELFASELGEALDVVARDVRFEVTAPEGVRVSVIHDGLAETSAHGLSVRLGDLVANQEVRVVLRVDIEQARPEGHVVEVRCRVRDTGGVFAPQPMGVPWRVVPASVDAAQPVNAFVVQQVAEVMAARARLQALAANGRRAFDEAQQLLTGAIRFMEALEPDDPVVRHLAEALRAEQREMAMQLDPGRRKARFMASYCLSESRDVAGKARRTVS